ncbi:MAG: 4'-phosphopantetheinyl transferase superfamily protein [Clostridia bacterium]|nr:4'-phosphopantetheinyl transferase superfamily protein [Clostridia bacterium]
MLQLAICHLPTYFGEAPSRELIEQQASLLPEEFRTRVLERKYLPSLLQSLGGMLLLRHLLGPEEFARLAPTIQHDKNGRPFLPGGELDFNISHSDDWAVCVLERDVDSPRVGVDIQSMPHGRNIDKIAKRFFTENEYDYYSAHHDRPLAFLRVWTRKEALVKWKSGKLAAHLSKVDALRATSTEPIAYDEYVIGDSYMLTVCHRRNTAAPAQNDFLWMVSPEE